MVKIQNQKEGQFVITVPLSIMRMKGWGKGTEVFPVINDAGDVVLKELKQLLQ